MTTAAYTYDPAGVYRSDGAIAPWARFFAKNYDLIFYSVGFMTLWFSIFGIPLNEDSFLLIALFSLILFPLFESLSQYIFGNTLGKRLLGLRIEASNRADAEFTNLLRRNYRCYLQGLALGIPLASLVTYAIGYASYRQRGVSSWDRESGTTCMASRASAWRSFLVGALPYWLPILIIIAVGFVGTNLESTFSEVSDALG